MEEISEVNRILYLASRKWHDEIDAKNFGNNKNKKTNCEPKEGIPHA